MVAANQVLLRQRPSGRAEALEIDGLSTSIRVCSQSLRQDPGRDSGGGALRIAYTSPLFYFIYKTVQ